MVVRRVGHLQRVLPFQRGIVDTAIMTVVVGVAGVWIVVLARREGLLGAGQVLVVFGLAGVKVVWRLTATLLHRLVPTTAAAAFMAVALVAGVWVVAVSALVAVCSCTTRGGTSTCCSVRVVAARIGVRGAIVVVLRHGWLVVVDGRRVRLARLRSARADIGVFIQRRAARVVGCGNGGRSDFSIEPLPPPAAETQQAKRENDTDDNETDNNKDTGDSARVVEERVAGSAAIRPAVEGTRGVVHNDGLSVDDTVRGGDEVGGERRGSDGRDTSLCVGSGGQTTD